MHSNLQGRRQISGCLRKGYRKEGGRGGDSKGAKGICQVSAICCPNPGGNSTGLCIASEPTTLHVVSRAGVWSSCLHRAVAKQEGGGGLGRGKEPTDAEGAERWDGGELTAGLALGRRLKSSRRCSRPSHALRCPWLHGPLPPPPSWPC